MATIVFRVNLETVNELTHKPPYNQTEGVNFKNTRVTWFPNNLRNNREIKHGVEFTAYDEEAIYLKNNFTSGTYKFLDIVSEE